MRAQGYRIALLIAAFIVAIPALPAGLKPANLPYDWKNVRVGGGGFSPGIVFSQAERNLAYLRTDIGGLYRWDTAANRWLPLQDHMPESNYFGIESVAPDPVDPNIVYVAAGMYRRDPAAILRSQNRGTTWQTVPVNFRMGGNESGRGLGERLAIDPNNTAVLYFGSRHDGLQRSTDSGNTWAKVESFPSAGLGMSLTNPTHAGLSFVVIDAASGKERGASRTIFVGDADAADHHLYRSNDAGATWSAVAGEPRAALLPAQAQLDTHGMLYITYVTSMGPNGIADGAVYKLNTHTGEWTDITPDKSANRPSGGYMGLSIDRQHPGTLVIATVNRWTPGDTIWRSTNEGRDWTSLKELSTRDVSATPFLQWGEPQPEFGHWMSGLAIDPFAANHIAYTTGATIHATRELSNADANKSMLWRPWVEGVEETAVITLTSPPAGPHLLSGFGDIGGFAHDDLDASPAAMFLQPTFNNTVFLDFAGQAPNIVVRSGIARVPRGGDPNATTIAWSSDYGKTWAPIRVSAKLTNASGTVEERRVDLRGNLPIAINADGTRLTVLTPEPLITKDWGKSWERVAGLPPKLRIVADRVRPQRLYAFDFDKSTLYVSNDGGEHFAAQNTSGLPTNTRDLEPKWIEAPWPFIATPDRTGELWLIGAGALFRSTDAGQSFKRIDTTLALEFLSFGKAPRGKHYPTLFAIGSRDKVRALWRSDNQGTTWSRINDDRHEYGRRFRCIAGDPRVYGRVYVGTDGRGILVGQPKRR